MLSFLKHSCRSRVDWMMPYQGMVVLAGNQIWWTWEVEDVFNKVGGARAHVVFCSTLNNYSVCTGEAESYVSHHPTSKHQCTRLSLVSNLNSQASCLINNERKPPYHIRKQKTERHKLKCIKAVLRLRISATAMPEYMSGWWGHGFESQHSQPFLLTYPEANFSL